MFYTKNAFFYVIDFAPDQGAKDVVRLVFNYNQARIIECLYLKS